MMGQDMDDGVARWLPVATFQNGQLVSRFIKLFCLCHWRHDTPHNNKNRDTQHTVNTVLLSVANKPIMLSVMAPWHLPMQQGTLTEGQGSVRVTFSLR